MNDTGFLRRDPEGPIADFHVAVTAEPPDAHGFTTFVVRITGGVTGITAEERSPVPTWALIRCWHKLATELRRRAEAGLAPASLRDALVAAEIQSPAAAVLAGGSRTPE